MQASQDVLHRNISGANGDYYRHRLGPKMTPDLGQFLFHEWPVQDVASKVEPCGEYLTNPKVAPNRLGNDVLADAVLDNIVGMIGSATCECLLEPLRLLLDDLPRHALAEHQMIFVAVASEECIE
jgi:hypothetical protein